jgi:threonine dehydratase
VPATTERSASTHRSKVLGDYLQRILTARVYDVADETALDSAPKLSARIRNTVLLKREDTQPVFSFKLRGAYNKMAHLTAKELSAGVVCASAGNHAQGVALSAQRLGCRAVIVVPETTPGVKVRAIEALGGEVIQHGESYSDAYELAVTIGKKQGLTFVHPFDDPLVIAGQGTIAMEILRQHQGPIDAVFVAIGGGGLISGIAAYLKSVRPEIKVIGVQTIDSDAMLRSVTAGRRVTLTDVGLFADGTAVRQVGVETFRLVKELVDDFVLVDTDEVCAAIKDVYEEHRAILEPSGALGVAGMKKYAETHHLAGKTFVTVTCGANINFDRLRYVADRAEVGEEREALFAVTMPEQPGSFLKFCELVGDRSVTEFCYRLASHQEAHIFVGLSTKKHGESPEIAKRFRKHGYETIDLTRDELAKEHVRHLVGGHPPAGEQELLYRFTFPERPGALMKFLSNMAPSWNISLFHYRSQGAEYGSILVAFQIPSGSKEAFRRFLTTLAYPSTDESNNDAYRLFLR